MPPMLGTWRALAGVCALLALRGSAEAVEDAAAVPSPPAVLWYAPFLSGGGYCSEAHSYVTAISSALRHSQPPEEDANEQETREAGSFSGTGDFGAFSSSSYHDASDERGGAEPPFSLLVTQHGDAISPSFLRDMPEETREMLEQHWIDERDFHWRLKERTIALAICHSEPGAWDPPRYHTSRCPPRGARYMVGRTMFETDRVPAGWADRMNKMDEIWVPTKFQENVFAVGGVREEGIKVVPEAVDVHFFDPERVDAPYDLESECKCGLTDKTTVFLSIFKWEERKAWRVLLKGYFQAFARDDDVVLVLLTNAYHVASESARDFLDIIEDFTLEAVGKPLSQLPRLHVLPPHVPQEAMPALYKSANAFVLPSRGEGWGRPHVEAMSMALPVIATFWSGTTEYMTDDNSYPLKINGLVEIPEGAFRGHMWADPSVEHLQELLQRVRSHPEEAIAKGKQARKDMVDKYSPEIIGQIVFDHITRILEQVKAREEEDARTATLPASHEEL